MFSHRLEYLNTWSPVGATVWKGCGAFGNLTARSEPLRSGHGVYECSLLPVLSHCFLSVGKNVICHLPTPYATPSPYHDESF